MIEFAEFKTNLDVVLSPQVNKALRRGPDATPPRATFEIGRDQVKVVDISIEVLSTDGSNWERVASFSVHYECLQALMKTMEAWS